MSSNPTSQTVFVTGATGLLGRNLVLALLERGFIVRALARSAQKAARQLGAHPNLRIVLGDMENPDGFASDLAGCDALFHTAAYFRDSYKGGAHWPQLYRINVEGAAALLARAHAAGVRRIVHASSIAVLQGRLDGPVDETAERAPEDADDYFRSKILSDREVFKHLDAHPDSWACFVLPGWMHGPGDLGPTSGGQFTLDFVRGALPGLPPTTMSFVDARDVASAMIAALEKGRRGERYLAAGRHVSMVELAKLYEEATGVSGPKRELPAPLLYATAAMNEAYARLTGRPVLLGLAAVRNLRAEAGRTRFDHAKSETELGVAFRPIVETLRDEVAWFRSEGLLTDAA